MKDAKIWCEFSSFLEDYFNDYLISNLNLEQWEVHHRKAVITQKGGKFTPDFCILHKESNTKIALEIDEPYTIDKTGRLIPIHFLGEDDQRNKFLIEEGWHILRFSERQVVTQPMQCCESIKGFENFDVNGIEKEPCWTAEQAIKMILEKYRDSYLPVEYKGINTAVSSFSFRSFEILNLHSGTFEKNGEMYYRLNLIANRGKMLCDIKTHELEKKIIASDGWKLLVYHGIESRLILDRYIHSCLSYKGSRIESFGVLNMGWFNLKFQSEFRLVISDKAIESILDVISKFSTKAS